MSKSRRSCKVETRSSEMSIFAVWKMHYYLGFTESFEGFFALAEAIVGCLSEIVTEHCWLLSFAAGKLKS